MDIQKDKAFTSLPEIAKLYQACKERDLTISEREYLKGARDAWQAAKAQAGPENKKFNLDEFLAMEEKLKHKGGVITADLDRFIAYAEMVLEKAKAKAVPDTYTPIVLALEDVQSKIEKTSFLTMDAENESEVYAVDANEISAYIDELIEAQESK